MNRILEIDPDRRFARVEAGRRARHAAEPRRDAQAHVRPGSVHAQPLHARRDDRQQLVRHALAARRQDRRQRRRAARAALRRHRADRRARRATPISTRSSRQGGRRGRHLLEAPRAFATGTPTPIRAKFPKIPRRVSGYNLDELLPENGFQRRARAGRQRRHLRDRPRREGHADQEPAAPVARRPRLRRRVRGRRSRARDPRVRADRPRRLRGRDGRRPEGEGRRQPGTAARRARASCSWSSAPTMPRQAADSADAARSSALKRSPDAPVTRLYTAPESKAVWKLRESGPRAAANLPGHAAAVRRMGRCGGGAGEARAYLRELRAAARRLSVRGDVLRPLRARLHPHAGQLRPADRRRAFASTATFVDDAADLVVRYGGSLSGEHGDGQSRSALLPKMFGPELMSAFARVQGRLGPRQQAEPRQHRRRLRSRPSTCGSARTTGRTSSSRRASSFPTMAVRWRAALRGASASASAASRTQARCARATW